MSVAAAPPSSTAGNGEAPSSAPPPGDQGEVPREVCPLCGGPLRADQDWCLRCGAAARTRLAAPPKWKLLVVTLLTIVVVALAVLVAALVKLAG